MLAVMRFFAQEFACLPRDDHPQQDATVFYALVDSPVLDPLACYLQAKKVGREELVTCTENYFGSLETRQEGNLPTLLDREVAVELPPTLRLYGTANANVPQANSPSFCWLIQVGRWTNLRPIV